MQAYKALHGGWFKGKWKAATTWTDHVVCMCMVCAHTHVCMCVRACVLFDYSWCVPVCIGKLITAKYIQEAKYHRWFPESAKAKKFLYPPD